MNGTIGSQAEKVKTFAEELRQQTKVPVEYRDERLSTVSARRLKQSGPKNNRKLHHDAMAAAVILQSYLDEAPSTAAILFPAFDVTTCEKYNCNQETFGGRMMKFTRVFRIMSLVVIVSMLLIALPATPALAAAAVTLSPAQGNIGDKITVRGSGFTPSTDVSEKWVDLYFTNKSGLIRGSYIDTDVTVYEKWRGFAPIDENGYFGGSSDPRSFNVPAEMTSGDGDVDVELGKTYYVLTTLFDSSYVQTVNSFTVAGGKITLDPKEGTVDTTVKITGTSFSASSTIAIVLDGNAVPISSGDTRTTSAGAFSSSIVIPDSSAGSHTISAIVSDYEVSADFKVKPLAVMTPTSGAADSSVAVVGTGFTRRKEVTVYFNKTSLTTALADANGGFNTTFTVPKLAAAPYTVEFEDADKNLSALKFTITGAAPPPTTTPAPTTPPTTGINITPTKGLTGSEVVVGGVGFKDGATISVKWDDKEVASVKSGAQGIFVTTFKVPAGKSGDHTVSASDGAATQKATFTVEVSVPSAPVTVTPVMGAEVKKGLAFEWRDVTVDSPPVTYTLQVAASQDFAASSIVLEKKDLADSEYAPTKDEISKLVGRETPYFWRVRATDSTGTDGPWAVAGQFFIPEPFRLPPWVMWVGIGVGVLVLLFIGYWLGRRSAYSY